MFHGLKIPDGDVPGIVDLDHITGKGRAIDDDTCSVKDDILLVIDPEQPVISRIRNRIGPGIEDDPGIAADVNVIGYVHIGLGPEQRA